MVVEAKETLVSEENNSKGFNLKGVETKCLSQRFHLPKHMSNPERPWSAMATAANFKPGLDSHFSVYSFS